VARTSEGFMFPRYVSNWQPADRLKANRQIDPCGGLMTVVREIIELLLRINSLARERFGVKWKIISGRGLGWAPSPAFIGKRGLFDL